LDSDELTLEGNDITSRRQDVEYVINSLGSLVRGDMVVTLADQGDIASYVTTTVQDVLGGNVEHMAGECRTDG